MDRLGFAQRSAAGLPLLCGCQRRTHRDNGAAFASAPRSHAIGLKSDRLLGAAVGAWRGARGARACGLLAGAGTGLALWALWRMAQAAAWDGAQWTYWGALGGGLLVGAWLLLDALRTLLRSARIAHPGRVAQVAFAALFAVVYLDLLLVFDGRYRDWPLPAFIPIALGVALLRQLHGAPLLHGPRARALALAALLLGMVGVLQEALLNPYAWCWLALNALLAWTALGAGRPAAPVQSL